MSADKKVGTPNTESPVSADKKKDATVQAPQAGTNEETPPTTATALPGKAAAVTPPGLIKPQKSAASVKVIGGKPSPAAVKDKSETENGAKETDKAAGGVAAPVAPKELPPLGFEMEEIGQEGEEDVWLNILIYGPSGVGKTYLIGTAQDDPETQSVFLIDAESGKATIRFKKGIRRVKVKDFSTIESIVDFLAKYCRFRDNYLQAQQKQDEKEMDRWFQNLAILFRIPEEDRKDFVVPIYRTVGIDSLTEIQQYDMREIMAAVMKEDPTRDPDVPSPREWGKSQTHIKELIRTLRAMPIHKIWAALPAERQDEKTKEVNVYPDLPGKLAMQVPGLVDVVGYYYSYVDENQDTQRILLTTNTGKYVAKDRTDALGNFVVNPTIPKLFTMIREYNAKMSEETNVTS